MAVKKTTTTKIKTILGGIEFIFDSEYSDTIFVDHGVHERSKPIQAVTGSRTHR